MRDQDENNQLGTGAPGLWHAAIGQKIASGYDAGGLPRGTECTSIVQTFFARNTDPSTYLVKESSCLAIEIATTSQTTVTGKEWTCFLRPIEGDKNK